MMLECFITLTTTGGRCAANRRRSSQPRGRFVSIDPTFTDGQPLQPLSGIADVTTYGRATVALVKGLRKVADSASHDLLRVPYSHVRIEARNSWAVVRPGAEIGIAARGSFDPRLGGVPRHPMALHCNHPQNSLGLPRHPMAHYIRNRKIRCRYRRAARRLLA